MLQAWTLLVAKAKASVKSGSWTPSHADRTQLPFVLQDIIDGRLEKQHRGVYGPPAGKHMAVFVDDLNMPQVRYRFEAQ